MIISTPPQEDRETAWPSLGGKVITWIERNLVFGPGDLRGQKAKVDEEKRALIWRFYEIFPQGAKDEHGKLIEGRRRFRRCAVSLQKGSAKTELAAWIAAAELHPEAPVRFDHFDGHGKPWGHGVIDPYIPLVAYTEQQSDDLAYSALKTILELSPIAGDFDIGLERIMRAGGDGKAQALAGAPDSRDGARTTFQHLDETHRWTLRRLLLAKETMMANLAKRFLAEPWSLETTTTYSPGEHSVAEQTAAYAQDVIDGKITEPTLFFFHRQASDGYNYDDPEQRRAAVIEAAGPTAAWKDISGIAAQWDDQSADRSYLERVWLNRPVAAAAQAFPVARWQELEAPDYVIPDRAMVTVGFDGARHHDGTDIVVTEIATGFQAHVGHWLPPLDTHNQPPANWEVPALEVNATMAEVFRRWDVWRAYCDPPYWQDTIDAWAALYGDDKIVKWETNRQRPMAKALQAYLTAILDGGLLHEAGERGQELTRAIGNARRKVLPNMLDDLGRPLWLIEKERPDSINKIDAAMAGVLSWEGRSDALEAGITGRPQVAGVYFL